MKWSSVLPVVAGVSSGVLAVIVTSHWSDARRASAATPENSSSETPTNFEAFRKRLERLEAGRRTVTLEVPKARETPEGTTESDPRTLSNDLPEHDERPSATEYFAGKLDEHRREGIDPAWAPSTQKALGLDLERVVTKNQLPARVLSVHCATTTCAVELEWPSFAEATRTYVEFVHTPEYSKPCARGLVLPEPARPEDRYHATLLLNCEEDRTGSSG